MDPFANDPYDSDSDQDASFRWPGVADMSEHAKSLMRGDFEVSPLVPAVPPMPEDASAAAKEHVPGLPSSFSRGAPRMLLKKRKVEETQGIAQAFGADQRGMPPPPPTHLSSRREPSHPLSAPAKEEPDTKPAAADSMGLKKSGQTSEVSTDMSRVFPPPVLKKPSLGVHNQATQASTDMSRVFPPSAIEKADINQASSSVGMDPPVDISGLQALSSMAMSAQQKQQEQSNFFVGSKPMTLAPASGQSAQVSVRTGQPTVGSSESTQKPESAKAGIFDDADDDKMAVDMPATKSITKETVATSPVPKQAAPYIPVAGTPPRPISESMKGLSPEQRPNIRSIVLGTPPKQREERALPTNIKIDPRKSQRETTAVSESAVAPPKPKPPPSEVKPSAPVKAEKEDGSPAKKSEKRGKRRVSQASRKYLLSKKDTELAMNLLRDKDDLLDCLTREECIFLAQNFWIITVQQLGFVLGLNACQGDRTSESVEAARRIREDVIGKLCNSSLLGAPQEGAEAESQAGTHTEDAMEVDSPEISAVDPIKRSAAEDKLQSWKTNIESYLARNDPDKERTPVEKRFPLDGPISCLLPACTRNFFATVPIKTLLGFLGMKRTETGAICDLLRLWRRRCNLPELSLLALAKHLIGVSSRVETVISAIPPVEEDDRKWMIDPIIVMTGAARDFLVERMGIWSAEVFIKTRTKDLAIKLAEWRETKGWGALKGSGKVAMVSSWKALAREAIEAQSGDGEVLKGVDLEAVVGQETKLVNENIDGAEPAVKSQAAKPKKRERAAKKAESDGPNERSLSDLGRQAQYALHTKLFLDDALGEDVTKFLSLSADITTAAALLELEPAKASALKACILNTKRADDGDGCESLINNWTDKLWKELEILSPSTKKRKAAPTTDKKTAPVQPPAQPPAKKAKTKAKSKSADAGSERKASTRKLNDPYEILSTVTRRFLQTLDISSAERFLTTRTTDIASSFVQWRIKQGMPELKGLGAIASVSGWKANIRKAALDLGMQDIAILEPTNRNSWGPYSRHSSGPKDKADGESYQQAEKIADGVGKKDLLKGKSRCTFAVVGTEARPPRQYRFELSIRKPGEKQSSALYITYKGSAQGSIDLRSTPPALPPQKAIEFLATDTILSQLSIMRDVGFLAKNKTSGDVRLPFTSSEPGMGLINLSEYGVRPVTKQDLSTLKDQLRAFIVSGDEKVSTPPAISTIGNVVLCRRSQDNFQYLLKLEGRIERGQTAKVIFPEASQVLRSRFYCGTEYQSRHLLVEAIHLLAREDLENILSFLAEEVLQTIGYEGVLSKVAAGSESSESADFKKACQARRRLHWVSLRIGFALSEENALQQVISDKLYFGPLTPEKDEAYKGYPSSILFQLRDVIASETKNEMLCALELDCVCGSQLRETSSFGWCPLAERALDEFVDCIINYYTASGDERSADGMLDKLKTCLSERLAEPFLAARIDDYVTAFSAPDTGITIDIIGSKSIRGGLGVIQRQNGDDSTANSLGGKPLIVCKQQTDDAEKRTTRSEDSSTGLLLLKSPDDVKDDLNIVINEEWYRQLQWEIAVTVVAKAGALLGTEERPQFMSGRVLYELKQLAMKETGMEKLEDPKVLDCCLEPLHKPASSVTGSSETRNLPEPHSRPFFLCLVWPTLRKLGWRFEAGELPDSVSFIAPDAKTVLVNRANPWKQQRDQSRARLAREANRVGLGQVSKLTKRLIVALLPGNEDDNNKSNSSNTDEPNTDANSNGVDPSRGEKDSAESKGVSAKVALLLFSNNLMSGLENSSSEDNQKLRIVAKKLVDALLECFEEVAPMLTGAPSADGKRSSDEVHDGCDYLLRFLLCLPSILRQSDLPLQEINDSLEVIQDLVSFITAEHESLFNNAYHPPHEHLARQQKPTRPTLAARLQNLRDTSTVAAAASGDPSANNAQGVANAMTELITEQDKSTLTDFVVTVLEQAVPCRATEKDINKKFRRIHVGYPGFVCRHCVGGAGEGRYFFTTIESLTTASTVFEKHVLKCPSVPPAVKSAVVSAKACHPEQRKCLPNGAQQAYFNRLWDRMRASKIEGVASNVYALESYAKKASDITTGTGAGESTGYEANAAAGAVSELIEFSDHVQVLDFVRKTAPWKSSNAVLEVLNQYYNCLDYGGRILYTASAPANFSAEWLLAKIAPRPRDALKKKRYLPG